MHEGCDIDESDDRGFTPLHLAIEHNNYQLFSLLPEKGALTKLFSASGSPLHLTTQHDFDGRFITALIATGAEVNSKEKSKYFRLTPLDCAIAHKNVKGVELLLKAKAIFTYRNRLLLESDVILLLHPASSF